MATKTIVQTIKRYGNSLIIPITKAAKEIGLQAGDAVIATLDNGLKEDCPVSFTDYVYRIVEDSKNFKRSSGSLFLTVQDSFWQTPEIIKGFVEKEIKKSKTPHKTIRLSDVYTDYDVFFRFDNEESELEVVIDHDDMKTTFHQRINWMWVETLEDRKSLVVMCDGYDFHRSIVFVTDCTRSEIPEDLLNELMGNGRCNDLRSTMIRYFEKVEEHPDYNEVSNLTFFKHFFNFPQDD